MAVISDLLSIREVAAALRLKPRTIEEWVAQRKIETIRPGNGRVWIREAEVDRILKEGTRPVFKHGARSRFQMVTG
jgi:excisionase family DNA binding protein